MEQTTPQAQVATVAVALAVVTVKTEPLELQTGAAVVVRLVQAHNILVVLVVLVQ
jgi:hypothetical protein